MKKTLILIVIFSAISASFSNEYEKRDISPVFKQGEKLVYEVSYAGFKIGTIKINSSDFDVEYNGVKVNAILESYKNIPFVSIKSKFESIIEPQLTYTKRFVGSTSMTPGANTYEKIYTSGEKVIAERWIDKKPAGKDTHNVADELNDGLSLFFYARKFSGSGKKVQAPVLIANKPKSTDIVFRSKKEGIKINRLEKKIACTHLQGKANWKGVYGLSGEFEGWFTDDEAKIPVLAYLNVIIGKVKIELKYWEREDWEPPIF